jgi:uroporphyrinogen decarboxylase
VRTAADVERLRTAEVEQSVPYVFDTLRILRRECANRLPLLGFAAAPFTLAAYLIEGRGSRSFAAAKRFLLEQPRLAHRLLERVAAATAAYAAAQVRSGAQAIQLFDTWAGLLGREEYREFALPYARRVLEALRETGVPRIYFVLDAAHLLEDMRDCAAEVVGLDWRLDLREASARLGERFVLQGNLDPCVLLAQPATVERRARELLRSGRALPGHVFNLGHGVLPETPVEQLEALIDAVHRHGSRAP